MSAKYTIHVRRGNSRNIIFRFPPTFDLAASTFHFFAKWKGGSLKKSLAEENVDLDARTVTLPLDIEDIRAFPIGRLTDYELERRNSVEQKSHVHGKIEVAEGINDDE